MRKRGMALPTVLVILLVGGALVAAAFYITENYYSSSKQTVTSARLYNAAVSGIEVGKGWIYENIANNKIPRWTTESDDVLSLADKPSDATYLYEALIAKVVGSNGIYKGKWTSSTEDGINLDIVVYDLIYEPASDLKDYYEKGFPPRIRPELGEGSAVMGSSYPVSNRGGGTTGEGSEGSGVALYLIRCTATYKDRTITVEQAFGVRP